MSRVLVIIPAYNEEATIAAVIAKLRQHAPEYDIVVVDDGSSDRTAAIAAGLQGVRVLQLPYNLGIGGAMQTGYKYALRHGYDVAVQCDADGQHPAHQIAQLVAHVEQGDAEPVIRLPFSHQRGMDTQSDVVPFLPPGRPGQITARNGMRSLTPLLLE